MVGLVIVSHSPRLAAGVAEVAREMGGPDVTIETAAGIVGGALGTDATLVAEAIEKAWSEDGVVVLMDLGSAVLSAEMALDLLPGDRRAGVVLCEAPIAEGAVAAAVTARLGASLDQVLAEARNGLAGKAAHLGVPALAAIGPADDDGPTLTTVIRIDLPHGLHARPAARLVHAASGLQARVWIRNVSSDRGPVDGRSLTGVASLVAMQGHQVEVAASGPDAAAVIDAVDVLAAERFGERTVAEDPAPALDGTAAGTDTSGGAIIGRTASPGIAIGPAERLVEPQLEVARERSDDPIEERRALDAAISETDRAIDAQMAALAARGRPDEAAIFDAHRLLLRDAAILEPARAAIDDGSSAEAAWRDAADAAVRGWAALDDPYLLARADDVASVARQVAAQLAGNDLTTPRLAEPGILIATDLAAADTASLGPEVLGIALAAGAPASHAMIVARSLGIPAVVGLGAPILGVADGSTIAIDATRATVYVDPGPTLTAGLEAVRASTEAEIASALKHATEPATTTDGLRIEVMANLSDAADATAAMVGGADGVGLFRSEFLFMGRDRLPDVDEQEAAYRSAAQALDGRPLTVRTLDVGGDKPLPGVSVERSANPALGLRGLRLGLARPKILATQLRALVRVAADFPVRVLFPMVASVDEVRAALAALEEVRVAAARGGDPAPDRIDAGIMVEVPAAALQAERLASEVDFLSIGTNDLTQYTLAVDRGDPDVASLADPLHPAVLDLIHRTALGGRAHGRPVAVCGELASDPAAVPLLIGLGVTELSVGVAALPLVKQAVRRCDTTEAARVASLALRCGSAAEVMELLDGGTPVARMTPRPATPGGR